MKPGDFLDFKQVKQHLDFTAVLEFYKIEFSRDLEQIRVRCPFHTPDFKGSCSINLERKIFQCFGCSKKGNILEFVALMEGHDPNKPGELRRSARFALEEIMKIDPAVVNLEGLQTFGSAVDVQYFRNGIQEREFMNFSADIGMYSLQQDLPHNIEAEQQLLGAILLNNDHLEKITSIVGPQDFFDPVHKSIFEISASHVSRGMLASPVTLKSILEDDAGLSELGGPAYLVRLAGAAISPSHVTSYARMIRDFAIRRALMEHANSLSKLAERPIEGSELRSQIQKLEEGYFKSVQEPTEESGTNSFLRAMTKAVEETHSVHNGQRFLNGILTGIGELDKYLAGFHQSNVYVIASPPTIGKTSLALDFAKHAAERYRAIIESDGTSEVRSRGITAFFIPGHNASSLAHRIVALTAGVPLRSFRENELSENDFRAYVEAAKNLEALPLFFDETNRLTISRLATKARRLKRIHGLDLLIVDSLQQLKPGDAQKSTGDADYTDAIRGIKEIARELSVPILVLSEQPYSGKVQLDRRALLSTLAEFGAIERYADVVLFLSNDGPSTDGQGSSNLSDDSATGGGNRNLKFELSAPEQDHNPKQQVELIIAKNRFGATGSLTIYFDRDCASFWRSFSNTHRDAES